MSLLKYVRNGLGKALRETGQALDRTGLKAIGDDSYKELWTRHRQVMNLYDLKPQLAPNTFVAPSASVIGNVQVWDFASIWYGTVIRGDCSFVKIGGYTNVQEGVVIDTVTELDSGFPPKVWIGQWCTIGHGALLTSCTIGDKCQIGMGSIIGEGCILEEGVVVGAGSVVPPYTLITKGEKWAGNPAVKIGTVDDDTIQTFVDGAEKYYGLAQEHAAEFSPYGTAYLDAEKVKIST